jgi:hypothetical protein
MEKKKIEFYDRIIDVKVVDIIRKTNLLPLFSNDKIYLQTQDGEEGCELEYHYEFGYKGNDPKEAIIDSLYVDNKVPTNLLKELEDKLYFKFVNNYE